MRRKDREVSDVQIIESIIKKAEVCRIALTDGTNPYIIPLNFGYTYEGGRLTLFFHCAKEGRKLDMIKANGNACFELEGDCSVVSAPNACSFTMEFESVIGDGKIEILADVGEKRRGMEVLMSKYAPGKSFDIPDEAIASIVVLKLSAESLSCKRNIK